jgi:amidase
LACDIPSSFNRHAFARRAFAICDAEVKDALAKPVNLIKTIVSGKVEKTSLKDIVQHASESVLKDWCNTYYHVQWAEIWSCLGTWVQEAKPEFGPATKMNFEFVKNMGRAAIVKAVRQREDYFSLLNEFLGPNDLLCMPTTPALAPIKGTLGLDRTQVITPDLSTAIAGIGRLPLTLPVAEVTGVPGLSFYEAGRDGFLLAAAQSLAKAGC